MQSKGQGRISAQTNVSASPNNSIKKSLRNIREKSHQEFYNNRAAKLGNIFTQNGFDLDSLVTEDEVLTFLDTLGKEPFNREIATQLFEKLPFHESGNAGDFRRFILRDFVDTHIKAEYLLLIRAEEIEGELDTVYNQIEGLRDQFVEVAKKSEARIENNTLQVDIVEVVCDDEEYQAEIGSVFSVIVVVGNYKYETDEIVIDQPKFNPKFNWTFHFKFDTPDEKMQILLRDQKRFGTDDDYTDLKCTINLKNYRDQIKHVTWLTLYNAYQQPTKFKVHLDIQWQFSKLAFHEEKFAELQVLEEKLNEEKEYIETSIKLLVHPFAFASSSKTRGVSQGFKSDPNIRMTQSGDMIGTRQTVHESYSQSKDQPQPRLAQSYYSEQNAPYNKQPSIESNKSSAMLPEGNSRVAESLQSSKNPSELAMSDKKARVTQSYQSSTQPFQLGQNANVGGDFRKTTQGSTPVMPVLGGGNMGSANQSRHYVQSYPPEQNSASGGEGFRKLETFSSQGNTPVMPVLSGGNMGSANQSRHYVQSFQAEQNVVNVEGGGFRKLETFSSQGNTPVMPVLGGGNMGSTNQSRHYVQSYYPPEQNSASVGEGDFRKMETFSAQGNTPVIPVLGGGSANQSRNYSQNYQPTQPYQPYQQEQGGLQKLGTFSAQGNTPVMPVLGGGNMGSANQSRHYGGIGGGFSPQVNSPYRQPSDASETSIKRITAKNPFENPALDYKGAKLVPQTTGNFGAFGGDRPVIGADPLRRLPSNQSEKSMRSAEAAVGIQPKRFENVKSGNQSRDQAELRADMQAGQSYMSNQPGKANRVGSDPLRPEVMGYDQRGYRKNPSNFA